MNLRTLLELMGHSTIAMTMRYAHLAPGQKQEAVDMLVGWSSKNVPDTKSDTGKNRNKQNAPERGIKLVKSAA